MKHTSFLKPYALTVVVLKPRGQTSALHNTYVVLKSNKHGTRVIFFVLYAIKRNKRATQVKQALYKKYASFPKIWSETCNNPFFFQNQNLKGTTATNDSFPTQ